MSSVSIFEPGGDPGEAYYIADDGQLFTIAQDSPIQDIRELPIASVHEQTIHKVEDLPGCPSAQNAEHGVELPYLVSEPPDPDMDDKMISDDPQSDNSKHQYFQQSQNQNPKNALSLEDFVTVYTVMKCKACDFACGEKTELYAHIESAHLSDSRLLVDVRAPGPRDYRVPGPSEYRAPVSSEYKAPGLREDDMLIIADLQDGKFSLENSTETVILEDQQPGPHSTGKTPAPQPYFKFFLVAEKKEIFICTRCSMCLSSEDKMKSHVVRDGCIETKCKNCGEKFTNEADLQLHTIKCKVAVFKLKKKRVPTAELKDGGGDTSLPTIPEEENASLVDQFYKKSEGSGDIEEDNLASDEYKISRLTKNRTDLEMDGDKRVWVCSVKNCYAIFKEEASLDYHGRCHKEDDAFICIECPGSSEAQPSRTFSRWWELASHLYKTHKKDCDLYRCIQCLEYLTSSVSCLEKHCQTHANLRLYECDICNKGFNQYVQLKNHSVIHLKENNIADIPNWAKPKLCDICQKTFSDSKALKKHVQSVHSMLKPYICQICGYKSSRKANLKLHVRQHSGEKPYQCDECEYRTGDLNSLRRHKKLHSGEKPYACSLCSYTSIQSSNYKSHLKHRHHVTPDGETVVIEDKKKRVITLKPSDQSNKDPDQDFDSPPEKSGGNDDLSLLEKSERDLSLSDSLDTLLAMSQND